MRPQAPAGAASSETAHAVPRRPDLARERELWEAGAEVVAGLDEVGRGAWAGPLVVAAAALRADDGHGGALGEVRDSKQLSPARRRELFESVAAACVGWAVGSASAAECDELGMSAAQRLAARRALAGLEIHPDALLLDGRWDFVSEPTGAPNGDGGFEGPVRTVVGGDARCVSLAAASILAKVWRDGLMVQQAARYPAYDFDRNKGYPCPRHRAALAAWGPSAIHRRSWAFMEHLPCGAPAGEGAATQPRLLEHR
ncbi:MAG: ribonuclease HII [bacterium]|nr:ribonuclease HII [bacterium]